MKINLFKKRDKSLYAIQTGKYAGEFWVFIEKRGNNYCFLATPTMQNRELSIDIFESGKKSGIVDLVEELPSKIHQVCVAQYNKNAK